ncbi:hypothetical protein CN198_13800 [Sinorhizobium meliloti]|uniref:hypothetical protein n=1 Tax=Rhizobium meliloti TaxID=382 RepID=UPI000FDC2EE1|nr:hypothetical protein [Sinorhizobium meliloti]RVH69137.1 hypothetical protein CN198_13800 [Sinorhizobium meliloti]
MNYWRSAVFVALAAATAGFATSTRAVELRLKPVNGLCFLRGETAEEVSVLKFLDRALDKSQVYHSDVFMPCDAMEQIKKGERTDFYPIFVVMGTKTDGRLIPFSSMTIPKLKSQTEMMLKTYDFTKDTGKQVETLNAMAGESNQSTKFDLKANEQAIVDVTDKTLSVAQKGVVIVDGKEQEVTTIATSIIVDGYIAFVQGTDKVSNAKEFWRLQFATEWAARQVEVVK